MHAQQKIFVTAKRNVLEKDENRIKQIDFDHPYGYVVDYKR